MERLHHRKGQHHHGHQRDAEGRSQRAPDDGEDHEEGGRERELRRRRGLDGELGAHPEGGDPA